MGCSSAGQLSSGSRTTVLLHLLCPGTQGPSSSSSPPLLSSSNSFSSVLWLTHNTVVSLALSVHAQQSLFRFFLSFFSKPHSHLSLDFLSHTVHSRSKSPPALSKSWRSNKLARYLSQLWCNSLHPTSAGRKTAESGSYYQIITSQKWKSICVKKEKAEEKSLERVRVLM